MAHYIWQSPGWPTMTWNSDVLLEPMGAARFAQGRLLGQAAYVGLAAHADVLAEEAVKTAVIEGEQLDLDAVRSSVARRLGLPAAGLPPTERHVEGLVEMLLDATQRSDETLTAERVKSWHAALFPTGYSGMSRISVGDWRGGREKMRVVSGPIGRERVHYEAPPAHRLEREMKAFLEWFESSRGKMDGLIRAAMAHFWFVTIHPFDDGNGRVARAIADLAIAQDEGSRLRLYSVSAQISAERNRYYEVLERCQRGGGDISDWLAWMLGCIARAIERSEAQIGKVVFVARFWQRASQLDLSPRQKKVLNRLLEAGPGGFEGGLTTRKYVGMTRASRATAKREIADLVEKQLVIKGRAGGRSTSYELDWEMIEVKA